MTLSTYNPNQKPVKIEEEPKTKKFEQINYSLRNATINCLEIIQDFIIVILCLGLFAVMFIKIKELFLSLVPPVDFQAVTPDILFVLILVEIFRLLMIYLQEKEISVAVAVEISIVSILREVILRGVMEMPNSHVWSICGILLVLGAIMIIPSMKIILSNSISSYFRRILTTSNSNPGLSANNKISIPANNKITRNYLSRQNMSPFSKQ